MTEASLISPKKVSKSAVISVEFDLMDFLDCNLGTILTCPTVPVEYEVAHDGEISIEQVGEQVIRQFLAEQVFDYCMAQLHQTVKYVDRALAERKQSVMYPILKALENKEGL